MKFKFRTYHFLIFFVTLSCQNGHEPRPYPRVRTFEVTDISENGAIFKGEIFESSNDVIDHGFVWDRRPNASIRLGESISLGPPNQSEFSVQVSNGLQKDVKYYLKSYVKTQDFLVFGEEVSFVSKGSKTP